MNRRTYSQEERAEALGLALSLGSVQAAKRTGIPRRSISNWLAGKAHPEMLATMEPASREQVASRLWEAVARGTEEVIRRMDDPKARLADVARSLEVVSQQHALLVGGVTRRSESFSVSASVDTITPAQRGEAIRYAEQLLARLDAGDIDGVEADVATMLDMERQLEALITSGEATDVDAAKAIIEGRLGDG